jgi:hypothetical protein
MDLIQRPIHPRLYRARARRNRYKGGGIFTVSLRNPATPAGGSVSIGLRGEWSGQGTPLNINETQGYGFETGAVG